MQFSNVNPVIEKLFFSVLFVYMSSKYMSSAICHKLKQWVRFFLDYGAMISLGHLNLTLCDCLFVVELSPAKQNALNTLEQPATGV